MPQLYNALDAFPLVAGGHAYTVDSLEPHGIYLITGTETITGDNTFGDTGTVYPGLKYVWDYRASATYNGGVVKFHGTPMTAAQALVNHTVIATYIGGAWDVDFIPDLSASKALDGTKLADNTVEFAQMQQISTAKLLGRATAGTGNIEEIDLTAAGRALIDDANAAAQRTTLGLGTIATQAANSVSISGGSITGITDLGVADGGTGASTAAAARTNLGFANGTYTPTLTNVTNVAASTAYPCQYLQVGSQVTVSGKFDLDATAAGAALTQLGISLPVASSLTNAYELAGTAVTPAVSGECAAVYADGANDRAQVEFLCGDASNNAWYFTFTYTII